MRNNPDEQAGRTAASAGPPYWFARHSKSVIFLIVILAFLGAYLAFTIPV